MRKIIFFATSFFSFAMNGCPTCVGKITSSPVPFFDQEFYKPGKQANNTQMSAVEYGKKELQKLIDDYKGKK
jgi:hypothetical protein